MGINERPKWMIAAVAAIAATGVGGVALASNGTSQPLPGSVDLQDGVPVASATFEATASPFERNSPIVRAEQGSFTVSGDSLDSPVDTLDTSTLDTTTLDSVASLDTTSSTDLDSVASVDTDSVDVASADTVSLESPDDNSVDDSI